MSKLSQDVLMAMKDLTSAIRGTLYPEDVERRRTVQNDSGKIPNLFETSNYRGKQFQHGCSGWIESVRIWIVNEGTTAEDVILGFAAYPTGTEEFTITISCVPGKGWREADVRQQWNVYSCFVYVKSLGSNCSVGYDTEDEYPDDYYPDSYSSDDSGVSWAQEAQRRYYIRLAIGQPATLLHIGGHVSIKEVEKYITVAITSELGQYLGIPVPTTITNDPQTYSATYIDPYETHTVFDLNPWHATQPRVILWFFLEVRFAALNLDYPFLHYNENLFFELDDGAGNTIDTYETKKETSLRDVGSGVATLHLRDKWVIAQPYYIAANSRLRLRITNYTFARLDQVNPKIFYIPVS